MWEFVRRSRGDVGIARCMEQGKTGELIKTKDPKSFRIWDLLARREGFEPPAFWSVGCLKGKSESFRLRFVLFTTVRSAGFPLFPPSSARFFRILGQNWVKTSLQADHERVSVMDLTLAHLEKESFIIHCKNKGRIRVRFNYTFILCFLLSYCNLWSMHYMSLLYYVPIHLKF